jgi:hypothetical protein
MTVTEPVPAGTVTRYWKTGVIIGSLSLDGITDGDPASSAPASAERCQALPLAAVPGASVLQEQLLAAMNDLARADEAAPVTEIDLAVQAWRNGYDQPAFATPARYAAWLYLAAGDAPEHAESGCLAFSDPRAGSNMTAMPGLPFGRQFIIRPVPGACAVVPGWLTSSVVPLEPRQQITIAVASGR